MTNHTRAPLLVNVLHKIGYQLDGHDARYFEDMVDYSFLSDNTHTQSAELHAGYDIGYRAGLAAGNANLTERVADSVAECEAAAQTQIAAAEERALNSMTGMPTVLREVEFFSVGVENSRLTETSVARAVSLRDSSAVESRVLTFYGYGFEALYSVVHGVPDELLTCNFEIIPGSEEKDDLVAPDDDTNITPGDNTDPDTPQDANFTGAGGVLTFTTSPFEILATTLSDGASKYLGHCEYPMFFEDGTAPYPIDEDVMVKVSVSFNGARRATTFPFTGLTGGDTLNMMAKAFTTTHHGELDSQEGVPVIQGVGFDENWQYRCVWDHNEDDASYQPAVWIDDEHVKCAEFPPASWSGDRLQAQYDGGEQFNIHIHLEYKLDSQDVMDWRYAEFADGSDGPIFPYDFGRCTDGILNGGEYLVDCGNRAGCGKCADRSISVDGPCDYFSECDTSGGCKDGKCASRPGLEYSGNTASSCKDVYARGARATGQYQLNRDGRDRMDWCEMDRRGGGWTLVAHLPNRDVGHWHHGGNRWRRDNAVHGSVPTSTSGYRSQGYDFKSRGWSDHPFNEVMLAMGSIDNDGGRTFNMGHRMSNMWDVVNGRGHNYNGPGVGFFRNWGNKYDGRGNHCWSDQPHCRYNGFNMRGGGNNYCRFGITGNNEGNCGSNDMGMGFGCRVHHRGSWSSGWRSAWHCSYRNDNTGGWIWVR